MLTAAARDRRDLSARGDAAGARLWHPDGPRLGRPRIVAALAWHSFRSAFGFGRGAKAKIVPVIAMIGICLPAVVNGAEP